MPAAAGECKPIPCSCCGGVVFKEFLKCRSEEGSAGKQEEFSFVKCGQCGLVQRNPQPLKENIISRYSEIFGNEYLAYELENEKKYLDLQLLALKDARFFEYEKELFQAAEDSPSALDAGCATGMLLEFLSGRKWRVTGVEISPAAQYARKERALDVKSLPLEENHFPVDSFDAVHASHLIEHLNDPRSFLAEAHRILKNDGRLFITTPNIDGFQARLYKERWRSAIFDHLYLFSVRTLKKMLLTCGFITEHVSTWGGLAAGLAPAWVKKPADLLAKIFGFGDVMVVRARKA